MPSIRVLCIIMLSFLVTACGGGGSLEKEGSIGGNSGGTSDDSNYTLILQGYSKSDGSISNSVSASFPLELRATLEKDGVAISGERVTFILEDQVGELNPISGSALTNSEGVAQIELKAGTVKGAGEVTAAYSVDGDAFTASFSFESAGDAGDSESNLFSLSLDGFSKIDGSKSNIITAASPLELRATLRKEENAIVGERIKFSLADDIGKLNPVSGTAITDSNGTAAIELTAGVNAGAGEVTATYTLNGIDYSDTFSFKTSGDQVAYTLSIQGYSKETGAQSNTVTSLVPLELKATVIDDVGAPVAGKSVTFALDGTIGSLNPASGSVLTDDSGVAQIELTAGETAGASKVVVSYIVQGVAYSSAPFDFETVIIEKAQLSVNLIASDGTETRTVDYENPAVAQATLLVDG